MNVICYVNSLVLIIKSILYSTVQASILTEKVKAFLSDKKPTFGDFTIKEFQDEFLKAHVISVSLCDTDVPGVEKKVWTGTSLIL